jgi:phospholipid/cholesterol/gamma-HCH transport system permease protein
MFRLISSGSGCRRPRSSGLAIALIGCRQGLEVGGSVQSLGHHTTKSVVQALFAIIVIDACFALFYQEMGI